MIKQHIFTVLAALFFMQEGIAQYTKMFTDSRDGHTYKTISFRNDSTATTFTWMAQNLNYKTLGSYAYDDTIKYGKELGLLYTWEAARNACPTGWHLPTDEEWSELVSEFGGTDEAGEALKSVNGWREDGNGTNSSGFNAYPGGLIRPDGNGIVLVGSLSFWWSSTATGEEGNVWSRNLHYDIRLKSKVFRFPTAVGGALSVRCVRNLPDTINSTSAGIN